jgi:hypothetical protein
MMDCREYYVQQSAITDPHDHAAILDDLPVDVQGLCSTVKGLVVHHLRGPVAFGGTIPEPRLGELDTCHVSRMLDRIVELDDRPLQEPRRPGRRLVGCCRDFAVLFCALARHKGIPARVRFGFSRGLHDGFNYLHVVTECWDATDGRWVLIDPELGEKGLLAQESPADRRDGAETDFITGAGAWRAFRESESDPQRFGRAPGTEPGGADALARSSMLDLAALNKEELLLWTGTGPESEEFGESDRLLLDHAAKLAELVDDGFSELQDVCQTLPKLASPLGRGIDVPRAGGAETTGSSQGQVVYRRGRGTGESGRPCASQGGEGA